MAQRNLSLTCGNGIIASYDNEKAAGQETRIVTGFSSREWFRAVASNAKTDRRDRSTPHLFGTQTDPSCSSFNRQLRFPAEARSRTLNLLRNCVRRGSSNAPLSCPAITTPLEGMGLDNIKKDTNSEPSEQEPSDIAPGAHSVAPTTTRLGSRPLIFHLNESGAKTKL